jgi:preprotein translocase subunit SecD
MKIRLNRFNTYLALLGALALLTGCQSPENRMRTALKVHLETNRDSSKRGELVPVYRSQPFMVNIDKSPLLTEKLVAEAKIVDDPMGGGFQLSIKFERRGVWLLEQYSTANLGKRLAIFCQFASDDKAKETVGRWVAAPVINKRITDGTLVFTPDADRPEALRIMRGLNNEAKKHSDTDKW